MIATKQMDIRANLKENNELQKAKRNAEYLAMLDKSIAEIEAGGFVTKTIKDLEDYE